MTRPSLFECSYAHDRRKHRHRCQGCTRIVEAGTTVLMWRVDAKTTRVLHVECADKPSFDNLTHRQLAQLHCDEYAHRLGYAPVKAA